MSEINLKSIPEGILPLLQERQLELKKKHVNKSLAAIYVAYVSEQLARMSGKVTKDYPLV